MISSAQELLKRIVAIRDEHRLLETCLVTCAELLDDLEQKLVDVPAALALEHLDSSHNPIAALSLSQLGELVEVLCSVQILRASFNSMRPSAFS